MDEAAALKGRAGELRKLEGGMVDIGPDGYKVPQGSEPRLRIEDIVKPNFSTLRIAVLTRFDQLFCAKSRRR